MPKAASPAPRATADRLLDVAERLFAQQGIAETSLRQLTAKADANVAAVSYHFGSRDGLIEAVFRRRIEPMNAERLERLDALEGRTAKPSLRAVLEAFLLPALHLGKTEGRAFFVLMARAHVTTDPHLRKMVVAQFGQVAKRFTPAFQGALPGASREELMWRLFFVIGALCQLILNTPMLTTISRGACNVDDEDAAVRRLLDFAEAGLRTAQSKPGRARGRSR